MKNKIIFNAILIIAFAFSLYMFIDCWVILNSAIEIYATTESGLTFWEIGGASFFWFFVPSLFGLFTSVFAFILYNKGLHKKITEKLEARKEKKIEKAEKDKQQQIEELEKRLQELKDNQSSTTNE